MSTVYGPVYIQYMCYSVCVVAVSLRPLPALAGVAGGAEGDSQGVRSEGVEEARDPAGRRRGVHND